MKRQFVNILLIISLAVLGGCSGAGDASRRQLSVSIEPQQQLLQEIVGDQFDVVALLPNGANPENYDPTVKQRLDADRSLIYFTTGFMPFEQTIAGTLGSGTRVVDTSAGIDLISGTHGHSGCEGHHHGDADPHIWTSVRNARQMAHTMAQAVIELDPENAAVYSSRLLALDARLDSLDQALARQIAEAGVHAFMVWHPSLSYYARDYGLHQISAGYETKEQSLSNLKSTIEEAKADSVKVFFFQKEYDSRQAQTINNAIGATMVTINPLAYDWQQELINITDALTR